MIRPNDVFQISAIIAQALVKLDIPKRGSWGYVQKRVEAATYITDKIIDYLEHDREVQ